MRAQKYSAAFQSKTHFGWLTHTCHRQICHLDSTHPVLMSNFFFLSSTSCETLHLTSPKRSAEKHSSNMNGGRAGGRGVCMEARECVHLLRQTRIYGILLHGSNVNREAHEYSCLQKSNDGNATMGCESEGIELSTLPPLSSTRAPSPTRGGI